MQPRRRTSTSSGNAHCPHERCAPLPSCRGAAAFACGLSGTPAGGTTSPYPSLPHMLLGVHGGRRRGQTHKISVSRLEKLELFQRRGCRRLPRLLLPRWSIRSGGLPGRGAACVRPAAPASGGMLMPDLTSLDLASTPLDGPNLIEANAGTGKTYAITALMVRLIVEKRLTVDQVLVVTFTVAATEELRARIRKRLREASSAFAAGAAPEGDPFLEQLLERTADHTAAVNALNAAIRDFDTAAVYTIHSFCQRVLATNAFETNSLFDTDLLADQEDLLESVAADFWRGNVSQKPTGFLRWFLEKASADRYINLAKLLKNFPFVQPDIPGDAAPLPQEEEFEDALRDARTCWEETRDEVVRLLTQTDSLNGNKYRKSSIPVWAESMDALMARSSCGPGDLFDKFEKFTDDGIACALKNNCEPPEHLFFGLCQRLQECADALTDAYEAEKRRLELAFLDYVRREMGSRKLRRNVMGYDDLLTRVRTALDGSNGRALQRELRQTYAAALIDEFQDTDPVQFAIFDALFNAPSHILFFLIGDPKQAIYSFRGADIFAYIHAARRARRRYGLSVNYRSEPGLIEGVNAMFQNCREPFVLPDIPFQPSAAADIPRDALTIDDDDGAALHIWRIPPNDQGKKQLKPAYRELMTEAVRSEIVRLLHLADQGKARLGNRRLRPRHMAVLVRGHDEGEMVQNALKEAGVPAVAATSRNIFSTDEARELLRLVTALLSPASERDMRSALATRMVGLTATDLDALGDNVKDFEAWIERFVDYRALWSRRGFTACISRLFSDLGVRARLLRLTGGERALTNVLHLVELVHQQERESGLGMSGIATWLSRTIAGPPKGADEQELRLESDDDAVRIVTIHKSKGLQYPVVFCPFMILNANANGEVLFHDPAHGDSLRLGLHDDSDLPKKLARREVMAENLRLAYVALTRARNRCYTSWGSVNGNEAAPFAYLLHADEASQASGRDLGADPASFMEDLAKLMKAHLTSANIDDRLGRLATECAHIAVTPPPSNFGTAPASREDATNSLTACDISRDIPPGIRFSSFTGLTRSADHVSRAHSDEESADSLPLLDFPRGADAGTMLHAFFENLDFRADDGTLNNLARAMLTQHGYDAETWTSPLVQAARDTLDLEIAPGVRLSEVGPDDMIAELKFHYPIARLTPATLRNVFSEHEDAGFCPSFLRQLESLHFPALEGYMSGAIDLVFRAGGRFWLLDWKSNHLGRSVSAYAESALPEAMAHNRYQLQYALYLAALDRHLARHVSDYDYETHMGGVFYVFLRGVSAELGPGYGVYRHRPSAAFLQDLNTILGCA
eukprot:TRINITY_DN4156_c0_g1_i2.p1 TRINITY_DN4156_c0_g1~~TRINITY_DN4156_c0_g1_i2.p1  ORF type:complete len:1316 (+),score=287.16 TRINITY_DN4156_c0_g1_i2:3026-6973(+)